MLSILLPWLAVRWAYDDRAVVVSLYDDGGAVAGSAGVGRLDVVADGISYLLQVIALPSHVIPSHIIYM